MNTRADKGANDISRPNDMVNKRTRIPKLDVTGRSLVLANESPEAWDQHLADHIQRYQPTSDLEREMVEDIAFCRWRLIRMRTIDTALWDIRMEEQSRDIADTYRRPTEPVRLAHAFSTDDTFRSAGRYEAHLRRSYNRAIRDLEQLRQNSSKRNGDAK
jgi:hypothetical protein